MAKIDWTRTKAGRHENAAQELMRYIEAARVFYGLTPDDLCQRLGWSKATYSRRKANPQDLNVRELQKLSDVLHFEQFPGASAAFAKLLV